MLFNSFIPCPQLLPYIESIWVQEDFEHVNYGTVNPIKVLPSTSVVMGFQYGERQEVISAGAKSMLSRHGVSGLQTGYALYKNSGKCGSIIIRFKPWAASHFFKNPISEFKDRNTDMELVHHRQLADDLLNKIQACTTIDTRIKIVEEYLISLLIEKPVDQFIKQITLAIQNSQGLLKIEDIAQNYKISRRQLERRFNDVVGISPKRFSSIVRFQSSIHLFGRNDTLTALAYDAGFFDQAHFIREFQSFCGETPEVFFKKELQPELSRIFNAKSKLSQFYNSIYQ